MTIPDPNPPDRGPSPSQVRQSRELLVEASLTTSKNVKSKNVKWTDACFRVRSTPSEAVTLSLTLTLALAALTLPLTLTLALTLALALALTLTLILTRSTPSEALDGGGVHLSDGAQERELAGVPQRARAPD